MRNRLRTGPYQRRPRDRYSVEEFRRFMGDDNENEDEDRTDNPVGIQPENTAEPHTEPRGKSR